MKHDPCFIHLTLAPVAVRNLRPRFCDLLYVVLRLVITDAFSDEILSDFLRFFDLVSAANPARENACAQQDLGGDAWEEFLCIGPLADAGDFGR